MSAPRRRSPHERRSQIAALCAGGACGASSNARSAARCAASRSPLKKSSSVLRVANASALAGSSSSTWCSARRASQYASCGGRKSTNAGVCIGFRLHDECRNVVGVFAVHGHRAVESPPESMLRCVCDTVTRHADRVRRLDAGRRARRCASRSATRRRIESRCRESYGYSRVRSTYRPSTRRRRYTVCVSAASLAAAPRHRCSMISSLLIVRGRRSARSASNSASFGLSATRAPACHSRRCATLSTNGPNVTSLPT